MLNPEYIRELEKEKYALRAEVERLLAVLQDIADAPASLAEQCQWWARKAICKHPVIKPHERDGVLQCTYCWERLELPTTP